MIAVLRPSSTYLSSNLFSSFLSSTLLGVDAAVLPIHCLAQFLPNSKGSGS